MSWQDQPSSLDWNSEYDYQNFVYSIYNKQRYKNDIVDMTRWCDKNEREKELKKFRTKKRKWSIMETGGFLMVSLHSV